MVTDRRNFLKVSGGVGLYLAYGPPRASAAVGAHAASLKIERAKETISVCPYCSVGCSVLVHSKNGRLVNVEGNPDGPINRGALCPKGVASIESGGNSPTRNTKVLYRAPRSDRWEEKSWDWAFREIAHRMKATRDRTFETVTRDGKVVNRMMGAGFLGASAGENEEVYAFQKFVRALGGVWVETQARI
jgi:formate dehydrogenase major subunit